MKHVTFAGSMAPYQKGEKRLLPDNVADELERDGHLTHSEPWPAPEATPPVSALKPARAIPKPQRSAGISDQRTAR